MLFSQKISSCLEVGIGCEAGYLEKRLTLETLHKLAPQLVQRFAVSKFKELQLLHRTFTISLVTSE
jgi:hypothetical protein